MRIAIPLSNGQMAQHFGHCQRFALVDVEPAAKSITAYSEVEAPPHQPGLLPVWLKERGVNLVIAGGMGGRALSLFAEASIAVITGAAGGAARTLAQQYLDGALETGPNACDH